jgi:hypothetical protein
MSRSEGKKGSVSFPLPNKGKGRRDTRKRARAAGRRSGFEIKVESALQRCCVVHYETTRLKYPQKDGSYVPDFEVIRPIRTRLFIEAKGRFLGKDRTKLKAVKAAHPEIDLRIVFQRNAPICKGSKTRNLDWAAKNGFIATVFPELPI